MKPVKRTCGLFLVLCLARPITSDGQGDHELWELLRAHDCNSTVVEAWQELASRPQTVADAFSGEQYDLLLYVAKTSCPVVGDMEEKLEKSKNKVDKSALENIQVLLSDDLIKIYNQKKDQHSEDQVASTFELEESLSVIDERFRIMLNQNIKEVPRASSRIQEIIDKYIFSACAEYNTKMHETVEKLKRISPFLPGGSFRLQKRAVQNGWFRFEWCKPFVVEEERKERLKKEVLKEFDQTSEDKERWKLLKQNGGFNRCVRITKSCSKEVCNAWLVLATRPDETIKNFSSRERKLLVHIATVVCPKVAYMKKEFLEVRKVAKKFYDFILDIEQLLSDDLIKKIKSIHKEVWHDIRNSMRSVKQSFLLILKQEPDPLQFDAIMDKYVYKACENYIGRMCSLTKLDKISRFVKIDSQNVVVQNVWYRFKWCQKLQTDDSFDVDLRAELIETFRHYKARRTKRDDSSKSK